MSAELIERLQRDSMMLKRMEVGAAVMDALAISRCEQDIHDATNFITSQDKRIAELEGIVAECERQFQEQVALRIDDMDKAESALSAAEARGRQIGREEAAVLVEQRSRKIQQLSAWADPGDELADLAAAIRNLPTNEAGE